MNEGTEEEAEDDAGGKPDSKEAKDAHVCVLSGCLGDWF
jgi:hypothetical protein